jgi:DNA-binding IclR family transcriptional regulator
VTDTAKPKNGKTQANHSVAKAMRILDYFRTHPQGRLSDLAQYSGLGPSTALRLILSLEQGGALVRHRDTREYSIGPWILELGARTVRSHPYTVFVHQILSDLCETTDETASYWIVDQNERLCTDRVLSGQALSSTIHIGTRVPLHLGAAGRALVAFLSEAERERLIRELRDDGADVSLLVETLDQVRNDGVAVSVEERERGLASVAVPVLDQRDHLVGALSVTAPVGRFSASRRRAAVEDLKRAADRLSTYRVLER